MTKKIILTLISIFLLCGCNKETIEVEEKTETRKDYYPEAVTDIYDEYAPMLNTVTKLTYFEEEYSKVLLDGINDVLIKYHKLLAFQLFPAKHQKRQHGRISQYLKCCNA